MQKVNLPKIFFSVIVCDENKKIRKNSIPNLPKNKIVSWVKQWTVK